MESEITSGVNAVSIPFVSILTEFGKGKTGKTEKRGPAGKVVQRSAGGRETGTRIKIEDETTQSTLKRH